MDPRSWATGVLRYHLCETTATPMYCEICDLQLCNDCVGKHLSDQSKDHNVVRFGKKVSTPKCQKHSSFAFLNCATCASSEEQQGQRSIETMKNVILKDLEELKKTIYPKYGKIESYILDQQTDMNINSQNLTQEIDQHGKRFIEEINSIIQKLKSDLHEMELNHKYVLRKQKNGINRTKSEIKQRIAYLEKLLNSNDVSSVSAYQSRNAEFKTELTKLTVSLPRFTPHKISKEQLNQQFGSLSALSIKTEESDCPLDSLAAESSSPGRPFTDAPWIITDINTDCGKWNLRSVSCLSDEEIWTCGEDNIMRLYNLRGGLLKSTKINPSNIPQDIATFIKLKEWRPQSVCITSSGDLLVIMNNDENKQTKVARYSGAKEKQSIQYNDKGQPLYSYEEGKKIYSSGYRTKYIIENRNLDICVTDCKADIVVVVNQAGKLRFTYNGFFNIRGSFYPRGITGDSLSRLLTADYYNKSIHILDQDGQFLRYFYICSLHRPWGLCVDTRDNLFVAEHYTGKMKKIQYYM
ncbi:uncharacterized protein LOC128176917 [Crassostrea angulata]|uniref:uncharacterized protein LOC128176917 n=1 Tax=Magallana angulata TaxID=2784310 RepID=UPI0022B089B2|nr:uncharacterized protein LOC128176917 [Crassostrea angulata]